MTTPRKRRSFLSADLPAIVAAALARFFVLLDREGEGFEGAMIGVAVEKTASLPNLCWLGYQRLVTSSAWRPLGPSTRVNSTSSPSFKLRYPSP